MRELHMIKLKEGEEIILGPSRKASSSNLKVTSENNPLESTFTSFRTVCITNSRIIVESGDSAIQYPNTDVSSVHINRNKKSQKKAFFNILKIKTKSGNSINLDIVGIDNSRESELATLFPNANVINSGGFFGFLDRVLDS